MKDETKIKFSLLNNINYAYGIIVGTLDFNDNVLSSQQREMLKEANAKIQLVANMLTREITEEIYNDDARI